MIALVGCSDNNLNTEVGDEVLSNNEISYSIPEFETGFTRGISIDDVSMVGDFSVFAVRRSDAADHSLYINGIAATRVEAGVWGFSETLYYPLGEGLAFWCCLPTPESTNGVAYSFSLDGSGAKEELKIDYTVPTVDVRDQPDIMVAPNFIGDKEGLAINFDHMLTKITVTAKLAAEITDAEGRFVVTDIKMNNIATKGELTMEDKLITSTNDSGDWTIDQTSRGEVVVTTDQAIAPECSEHTVYLSNTGFQDVMIDGEGRNQALFMIPQRIDNLPSEVAAQPTIVVTVYDSVNEVYYRTPEMLIPTFQSEGWLTNKHINMQLVFDPSNPDLTRLMTIYPIICPWYYQEVNIAIENNLILWCDIDEIDYASNPDGRVKVYTNCEAMEATSEDCTCSLVGSKIDGYFNLTVKGNKDIVNVKVTVTNKNGKKLTKIFPIQLLNY